MTVKELIAKLEQFEPEATVDVEMHGIPGIDVVYGAHITDVWADTDYEGHLVVIETRAP